MAILDSGPILGDSRRRRRRRGGSRPRERAFPLMDDIEQAALTKQLTNVGLSTLSYVGETLDKPGRAVRGLLSGQGPEALLNLIPYSDKMEITSPGNAPTGREMLESLGIAGTKKEGQGWGEYFGDTSGFASDLGGFALEVALDPLTYLTLGAGALTKTGKAARAGGVLPKRSFINAKSGKVMMGKREARLSTPRQIRNAIYDVGTEDSQDFMRKFYNAAEARKHGPAEGFKMFNEDALGGSFGMFGHTLTLPGAMGRAKWMDQHLGDLRFSQVGRGAAAMFHAPSIGMTSQAGQVLGPRVYDEKKAIDAAQKIAKGGREEILLEAGFNLKRDAEEIQDSLYRGSEGFNIPESSTVEKTAALRTVAADFAKPNKELVQDTWEVGLPSATLQDEVVDTTKAIGDPLRVIQRTEYMARGPAQRPGSKYQFSKGKTFLEQQDEHMLNRRKIVGFMEGTRGFVDALADPRLTKGSELLPIERADILGREYMGWLPQEEIAWGKYNPMAASDELDLLDNTEQLIAESVLDKFRNIEAQAEYLFKHETGTDIFDKEILQAQMERQVLGRQTIAGARANHNLFGQMADYLGAEEGGVSLAKALNEVGITGENGIPQAIRSIARWGDARAKKGVNDLLGPNPRGKGAVRTMDEVQQDMQKAIKGALDKDAQTKAAKVKIRELRQLARRDEFSEAFDLDSAVAGGAVTPEEAALYSAKYPKGFTFEKELKEKLKEFTIPQSIMKDATRLTKNWSDPEEMGVFLRFFDAVTDMFKAGVTTVFPGFHVRNYYSEIWNNVVADGHDPRYGRLDYRRWSQPFSDSKAIIEGKGASVKGLNELPMFKGLTNEQAARRAAIGLEAHGTTGGAGRVSEVMGAAPGEREFSPIPGRDPRPTSIPSMLAGAARTAWKDKFIPPVALQKLRKTPEDQLRDMGIVGAGRGVGENVENISRLATGIAFLRQGYSMAEAALQSKLAHVDYSALTQVEKKFLKRIFPFYSWNRHQVPYQISKMMQRPGGAAARAVRAASLTRTGEFVPEWASSGMTMKLSEDPQTGDRTFLGGIDLPHEAAFDMLSLGPTGNQAVSRTISSLMSQLTPALKVPIELGTDKSLFRRGTPLSELDPPLGRAISNVAGAIGYDINPKGIRDFPMGQIAEHLFSTSPVARLTTSTRKAFDPRKSLPEKALNLLSGARISTVGANTERQAIMNQLEDMMQGGAGLKTFGQPYASDKGLMSLENIELMRLYQTLVDQKRKQRAAEKKKQGR